MEDWEKIIDAVNFMTDSQGYVDINLISKMTEIPALVCEIVLLQKGFTRTVYKHKFIKKKTDERGNLKMEDILKEKPNIMISYALFSSGDTRTILYNLVSNPEIKGKKRVLVLEALTENTKVLEKLEQLYEGFKDG